MTTANSTAIAIATANATANATATPKAPQLTRSRPGWTPALLAGCLLALAAGPAQARCYTPTDQTAGWKRAPIPDEAPALAVAGMDPAYSPSNQFRADERAVVWYGRDQGSMALSDHHLGRLEYTFRSDGMTFQMLQLQLASGLAGEKVDVIGYGPGGPVPLWLERRISGNEVALEWALPGVYAVSVSFHHHLRERPVVTSWQMGLRTMVSAAAWLPVGFHQSRSLFYYHPGGRTVTLCDEPGYELALQRSWLIGAVPVDVQLIPR